MFFLIGYKKINSYLFIFLSLFLLHYFPFVRYSIGPDDYAFLHKEYLGILNLIEYSDRPLQYLFIDLQNIYIADNYYIGSIFNFISNLILLCILFEILNQIFNNNFKFSFVIVLFINLFITRAEIFHYPIYIFINLITSIYLISFFFFLKFIKSKKYFYFILSLVFYLIGIFGYEIGFFLIFVYVILYFYYFEPKLKSFIKIFIPLFLLILFYLIYRYSNSFNLSSIDSGRSINFNFLTGIIDIFNIFIGRYFIKYLFYGFYEFINYKLYLIVLISIFNFIFIFFVHKFLSNIIIRFEKKYFFIFLSIFFVGLIPNFLVGSIGGRNITISLLGLSPLIIYLVNKIKINKLLFLFLFFIAMVINQGNNFSQVTASKINYSLNQYILTNSLEITKYDNIIIDLDSFKKHINFNLYQNPNNNLNYFFTAQLFEDWGISGMIKLLDNYKNNNIYLGYSKILEENNLYKFSTLKYNSYRNFTEEKQTVKINQTHIIDFDMIYNNSYNHGLNEK